MAICPCCNQTIRQNNRKASVMEPTRINTSEMTDREIYAFYKRTARREDLNFRIRNLAGWLSMELRDAFVSLRDSLNAGHISEREMIAEMSRLDARWRMEAMRREDSAKRLESIAA